MPGAAIDLGIIEALRIDETTKGFPDPREPVPLRSVAAQAWTLDDLQPPVMVIREPALVHNVRLMADYCIESGVELAPHGKTTMAPQMWARQLDAGAWGLTAATVQQARVMRACQIPRILIANQVVDDGAIGWVAAQLADPRADVLCNVDSSAGVSLLHDRLRQLRVERPLRVLVELGHEGGRAGCRSIEEGLEVSSAVRRSDTLQLAGVAAYEGSMGHGRSIEHVERVAGFLDDTRELFERLLDRGALDGIEVILSAGGSLFFDIVADRLCGGWPSSPHVTVLLRSGCYLTHDAGIYEQNSPFSTNVDGARRFHDAIDVLGVVQSRPEADLAIVGLGRRDVPFDQGLPIPRTVRRRDETVDVSERMRVVRLDDQHAYCQLDQGFRLDVGDLVSLGVSHPCTAFDKWRVIPVLDGKDRVVDAIATFF